MKEIKKVFMDFKLSKVVVLYYMVLGSVLISLLFYEVIDDLMYYILVIVFSIPITLFVIFHNDSEIYSKILRSDIIDNKSLDYIQRGFYLKKLSKCSKKELKLLYRYLRKSSSNVLRYLDDFNKNKRDDKN